MTPPDQTDATPAFAETPETGAVLYQPINAGDPGYMGSHGQLAHRRGGGWLYRGVSNCPGVEAMPSLLPPDLAYKLGRWGCLIGDWDAAAGEDDDEQCARISARLNVLVNDEMSAWSRALSEAYQEWDQARPRRTFETLNMWIAAPKLLSKLADAYNSGRRLRG